MSAFFFFQAEDGIRDLVRSRGLGDVYKRQVVADPELIYLDGNSLGRLPRVTGERQAAVIDYELSLIHI